MTVVTCGGRRCSRRCWTGTVVVAAGVTAVTAGVTVVVTLGGTLEVTVLGVCAVAGGRFGVVAVRVAVWRDWLMPEPNSLPLLPLSGCAPRAVASGNAYSFATGLLGSTWTPEPPAAMAVAGNASAQQVQASVCRRRARTLWRIAGLW